MTHRVTELLDAAIDVLATGGVRELTHRAVDSRAGLPMGSASNRFRTRDALLTGVLQRLLERETAAWAGLGTDRELTDIGGFAAEIGRLVDLLSEEQRGLTQARHAVFAEASHRPRLRQEIESARGELAGWAVPALSRLGSTDPAPHLHYLLALVDGLLAGRLVHPSPQPDPAAAVEALLRGLIPETPARLPRGR